MNLGTITLRMNRNQIKCAAKISLSLMPQPWHYLVNIAFFVFLRYPPPSSSAGQTRKGKGNNLPNAFYFTIIAAL
jgi:hypothetical protein